MIFMKTIFLSNFYNHHQSAISEKLFSILGFDYIFIETMQMDKEREKMGWKLTNKPCFVREWYKSQEEKVNCQILIDEADVVIFGSAPQCLIKKRLNNKKLTFLYSERIYKNGFRWYEQPLRMIKYYFEKGRYESLYLLCASAYTAADYAKTFTFLHKEYKWGYFPAAKYYENIAQMLEKKKTASILWAGRLIEWKHPEYCIYIAKKLKRAGYAFQFNIIGDGKLKTKIEQEIEKEGLTDCVHMLGAMKPEEVRHYMEESRIFLFTSDFREGWGAVLNESMNSGCAVVASHAIGSVPFLIQDKENGLIYKNGDLRDFYSKVKYLLDHPDRAKEFGANAYKTITEEWNAENAAKRLLELSNALINGEKYPVLFKDGPCSVAGKLYNGWYK